LEWFLQMVDRLREEERETALEVSCEVWWSVGNSSVVRSGVGTQEPANLILHIVLSVWWQGWIWQKHQLIEEAWYQWEQPWCTRAWLMLLLLATQLSSRLNASTILSGIQNLDLWHLCYISVPRKCLTYSYNLSKWNQGEIYF
jgi:hypothetical protein